MEQKLTRKYGLLTAICMVVGTVIGSGIFFRNEEIIAVVGGQMWLGVFAWLTGGLITLSAAYVFSVLATRHERAGGLVDYAEALLGPRYGYLFGWFMAVVFYPSMSGILAWITARFTVVLIGWDVDPFFSAETYLLALCYMVLIFSMNALSPKLAGKFQISTTFIKLIPLVGMGVVGTIVGTLNGTTVANLASTYTPIVVDNPFFVALVSTAFAYLGWESILALNSEVRNSKRNLPIALVIGLLIVMAVYALYFIGIFSAAPLVALTDGGGVLAAFSNIFGSAAGSALFAFIVISCLGALNGLAAGGQRAFFFLATRGHGPKPDLVSQVDATSNAPHNSAILYLFFVAVWMLVNAGNLAGWYGDFNFDLMGFIPITFQSLLIPVYVWVIFKERTLGHFNRFVAPLAALSGGLFMVYAIIVNHGIRVLWYLLFFAVIMFIGALFYRTTKD